MMPQFKRSTPLSETFFATLYDRSRTLIANAHGIIKRFEEADEKTSRHDAGEIMGDEWENENEMAARVIEIGHKVGVMKIKALLEAEEVLAVDKDDEDFVSNVYQEEVEEGEEGGLMKGRGWGKVAEKEIKAAGKLYRATLTAKVGS
jgi:hypothetical protein